MHEAETTTNAMSYRDEGCGEPALILVHGFLCRAQDWASQSAHFAAARRVITCELRGHGASAQSDRPGPAQAPSIDLLSDDLARLVGQLNLEKPVLVGHSMGSRVVIDCSRKLAGRIGGLVLIDGSRLGEDCEATLRDLDARVARIGYRAVVESLFDDMFLSEAPDWKAPIVDHALSIGEQFGLPLLRSIAVWDCVAFAPALRELRIPVLAIQSTAMDGWGRRSLRPGELAPFQRFVIENAPHASTETVTGGSHFCIIDGSDQVNDAIARFIAGIAPGTTDNAPSR